MEGSPIPWIEAVRHSHNTLGSLVQPLDTKQLELPSYATDWSIAQVLAHLGSGAEIFGLFLDAGLSGQDPPGPDAFAPIWEKWNARDPDSQASAALQVDAVLVKQFESLDPEAIDRFRLSMFGMEVDMTRLTQMRLSEHGLHTWDIAVVLDPASTLAPDAVGLLVDTLGQLVARTGRSEGAERRVRVSTTEPERDLTLEIGDTVSLVPSAPDQSPPDLVLPAEAFVRLVYGRLDPAHTPPLETRGIDLDELRRVFPGF